VIYLIIAAVIWGFSFGLIKNHLSGLDSAFISFVRLLISFLLFLPFLRIKGLGNRKSYMLFLTGIIQYGLMYLFYISSFNYLKSYEVALFTIFTPIYVIMADALFSRKINLRFISAAIVAAVGSGIIVYSGFMGISDLRGFILVQLSNICFAFGQIFYIRITKDQKEKDHVFFALLYLGGLIPALLLTVFDGSAIFPESISSMQILVLLYLGIIPSGLCFFLWNYGAGKTNSGVLAVMNNLKIPIGVIFSLTLFGESAEIINLIIGFVLILFSFRITVK